MYRYCTIYPSNPDEPSLQVLQEKIQDIVSASGLTVKVSSVGKSLIIKMNRTEINTSIPNYGQLFLKIRSELKTDVLKGFNNLLITFNFEGNIKSEWERQDNINEAGNITEILHHSRKGVAERAEM